MLTVACELMRGTALNVHLEGLIVLLRRNGDFTNAMYFIPIFLLQRFTKSLKSDCYTDKKV